MNRLLFNERTFVKEILETHDKSKVTVSMFQLIQLLVIYFYQEMNYTDKGELAKVVNRELEQFDYQGYFYEIYYKTINQVIKDVIRYDIKLKDITNVPIYQSEYDIIKSCGDNKHQKLLLTLYVMARWNNDTSGWTSNKCKTLNIKKSANLNCTNRELDALFHDLLVDGYIKTTFKADKFCYQMQSFETDKNQPIVLNFTSFDNLGNTYMASKDNEHIICSCCGKLIRRTSPRMKYCKKCAEKIHREQDKKYHEAKRKV